MREARFEWGEIMDGKRRIAYVEGDARDYARFLVLDPAPRQRRAYPDSWRTVSGSEHVPHPVRGRSDARRIMADWRFPAAMRARAEAQAADLTDVFVKVSRWQREAGQTSGRLDRRKLPALGRELERPSGDLASVRPYWRMSDVPAAQPTLYIAAAAGWSQMWYDGTYVPRVVELSLSVAWAAEAAGLKAVVALTQDHVGLDTASGYDDAVFAHVVYRAGDVYPVRDFAVLLHRDLWRHGYMSATASSVSFCEKAERLLFDSQRQAASRRIGQQWLAARGGRGVAWARAKGADVVVAIGELSDSEDADIRLAADFGVRDAVKSVAQQALMMQR
jgi:hypothetical protein